METEISLPHGREFELVVFGMTDNGDEPPDYLDFTSAVQEVIISNRVSSEVSVEVIIHNLISLEVWAGENGLEYHHDPTDPQMGKTPELFRAVKRYLPRRLLGKKLPLNLYVAIGKALDWYYGIDAFFWWGGVLVSLDASLLKKNHYGRGKFWLHADFVLNPDDLAPEGLDHLGCRIAQLLRQRSAERRSYNSKRRKIVEEEDES